MYSPNRRTQIDFVSRHLKEDGILLFIEKFRAADEREYERRELQKDLGFKSRYFPAEEVRRKKEAVLRTMYHSEVTLDLMAQAIRAHFSHCRITWNSGNFYGLAASNSEENLSLYLSEMSAPALPFEYVYEPALAVDASSWTAPSISEREMG